MKLPYSVSFTTPTLDGADIVTAVTVADATGRNVLSKEIRLSGEGGIANLLRLGREAVRDAICSDLTLADVAGLTLSWQIGLDTTMRELDLL